MTNYILSCCSTADLSEQHFQERDIHYICFHYMLNGKSYSDDLGKTMSFDRLLSGDGGRRGDPYLAGQRG